MNASRLPIPENSGSPALTCAAGGGERKQMDDLRNLEDNGVERGTIWPLCLRTLLDISILVMIY